MKVCTVTFCRVLMHRVSLRWAALPFWTCSIASISMIINMWQNCSPPWMTSSCLLVYYFLIQRWQQQPSPCSIVDKCLRLFGIQMWSKFCVIPQEFSTSKFSPWNCYLLSLDCKFAIRNDGYWDSFKGKHHSHWLFTYLSSAVLF